MIFPKRHVYSNMKIDNIFKQAFCTYNNHKAAYCSTDYGFGYVFRPISAFLKIWNTHLTMVPYQPFYSPGGPECSTKPFCTSQSQSDKKSKQTVKYLQTGILRAKYSQRGICLFVKIFCNLFFGFPENLYNGQTCRS